MRSFVTWLGYVAFSVYIFGKVFHHSFIHTVIISGIGVALGMGAVKLLGRSSSAGDDQEKERTPFLPHKKPSLIPSVFLCLVFAVGTAFMTACLSYDNDAPVIPSAIAAAAIMAGICGVYGLGHYALTQWRLYGGERTGPAPEGDTRPLLPRHREDARTPMDGSRLTIFYTDAEGQATKRTIRCQELNYAQDGRTITPFLIEAYCELRREDRSFSPRRIARATLPDGTPVFDITAFLVAHTDLPRQEGPAPTGPEPQTHTQKLAEAPPEETTDGTHQNTYISLDFQDGLRIPPPSETPDNVTSKLFHPETKHCRLRITSAWKRDRKNAKESIINPINLTYFMEGKTLCIMMIEAFIEETKEWKSVDYTDILTATDLGTGKTIDNLGLYLLGDNFRHYDPYARANNPDPKHKRIALKDTPLAISFTQKGSAGKEITLILKAMECIIAYPYGPENMTLDSVSGTNIKTNNERTIRTERITSAHDPETGEIIEDLLAFLETRRKRKAKA
ncbi:hypothetical protein [Saccharibacter floricola]|uniref:Uncharacterized protein n=1 Tax=Saccharibacter floricola DSM 15669 TaxID=1123227 RepID=A0ABQ0P0A8_9PROT|nr:hypothetical protein [Saccharibacter floricola]GBQ08050.1 hypothetical protein AA15669_1637 [Saccharibacter floricola DSM 15669]